jgi:hypothetical protein
VGYWSDKKLVELLGVQSSSILNQTYNFYTFRAEKLEGAKHASEHDVYYGSPLGEHSLLLVWKPGAQLKPFHIPYF